MRFLQLCPADMRKFKSKQVGFTLVEIAVVLVIVGLLVGSFIGTFADRIDTTRRSNTQTELDEIKNVLIAYTYSQPLPFLPCPDTDVPPDGLENRTVAGICNAPGGVLPWLDLGLGNEDAWGIRYSYWVSLNYSANTGFLLTAPDRLPLLNGNATVTTRVGNAVQVVVQNGAAVVLSRGKNRLGGISVAGVNQSVIPALGHFDENENDDLDAFFVRRTPTEEGAVAAGGIFDDVVVWINSYELKAAMVQTGVLPP